VLELLADCLTANLQRFRREQLLQARSVLVKLKCRDQAALDALADYISALTAAP
jgi:hypothetical protein